MKHFRLHKGLRRELEEISLGFVLALLFVAAVSTQIVYAQSNPAVIYFYGRTSVGTPCPSPPAPSTPCTLPGPKVWYFTVGSRQPQVVQFVPEQARSLLKSPRPAGLVVGSSLPQSPLHAIKFWFY